MKLFKVYLIIFLIVAAFVIGSRFFSPTYIVRETIVVNKPVNETFAYMGNLKNWEQWSLWNKSMDSSMYYFYNKQYDTLGARQYITGNLIGKGFIETTAFQQDAHLAYRMYMREGDMTANGVFTFTAINATQTEIAWIDSGDVGNNPIKRYMIPFVTKNTAETFKQGLERIKVQLEK